MYVEEKHEQKCGKDSKISAEWNASVKFQYHKEASDAYCQHFKISLRHR